MASDAKLIVIETNTTFVETLRARFPDPRLVIVHESASDVVRILDSFGAGKADYVISGIPFSFFDPKSKRALITDTARVLKPEGKFLIYQALTAPAGRMSLKRALKETFDIRRSYTLFLNLPPLYVFESRPQSTAAALKAA